MLVKSAFFKAIKIAKKKFYKARRFSQSILCSVPLDNCYYTRFFPYVNIFSSKYVFFRNFSKNIVTGGGKNAAITCFF